MSEQLYISQHRWKKTESSRLFKSIREKLQLQSLQFYMPLYSLYFYIHNTKKSHQTIDLSRKYYLTEITDITKTKYYNSNVHAKGIIYDSDKQIYEIRNVFCKQIPIIDPMHCIENNYSNSHSRNPYTPSCYNYNMFHKVNDLNNTAYIDVFCSYLFGTLTLQKKSPSFALFYGSWNGIGDYNYDITEDYSELQLEKSFADNLGKTFTLDIYNSSEDESDEDEELAEDCVAKLKRVPIQCLCIETLDYTLEDYLQDVSFKEEVLQSALFQIAFALSYLQKRYKFTHNDLHINNIMYQDTDTQFLYYKLNNKYFKVPTYGKIFKIIDFGRAIFTFKNKVYRNDVFSRNGEAGGQYSYPHQVSFLTHRKDKYDTIGEPNYNFDLCRLSMTILEEISKDKLSDPFKIFLEKMCTDRHGESFLEKDDDFQLYISIAKDAISALPIDIIDDSIFHSYRISKKRFPTKLYYTL